MITFELKQTGDFTRTDMFHLLDFLELQNRWNQELLDNLNERVDAQADRLRKMEAERGTI